MLRDPLDAVIDSPSTHKTLVGSFLRSKVAAVLRIAARPCQATPTSTSWGGRHAFLG